MSLWISRCGAFCRLSKRARTLPDGLGAAPGPTQRWNHIRNYYHLIFTFIFTRIFSGRLSTDVWFCMCSWRWCHPLHCCFPAVAALPEEPGPPDAVPVHTNTVYKCVMSTGNSPIHTIYKENLALFSPSYPLQHGVGPAAPTGLACPLQHSPLYSQQHITLQQVHQATKERTERGWGRRRQGCAHEQRHNNN